MIVRKCHFVFLGILKKLIPVFLVPNTSSVHVQSTDIKKFPDVVLILENSSESINKNLLVIIF